MREQDLLGAFPLFLRCRNLRRLQFPLAEIWHGVDDDPWDATAEVHDLETRQTLAHSKEHTLTSCSKKLIKPVAMTGLPIETYQFTHWCSSHDSDVKSVPEYSSARWSTTVEFIVRSSGGPSYRAQKLLICPGSGGGDGCGQEQRNEASEFEK